MQFNVMNRHPRCMEHMGGISLCCQLSHTIALLGLSPHHSSMHIGQGNLIVCMA